MYLLYHIFYWQSMALVKTGIHPPLSLRLEAGVF